MRFFTALILCMELAGVSTATQAASSTPATPVAAATTMLGKPLKDIAFANADDLHIVSAGEAPGHDKKLRWLTWGERTGQGSIARLALLGNDAKGTTALSVIERADAYAPAFAQYLPWRYGQYPVQGWTYMQGAAVQALELYGINEQGQAVKLDELSGMAIGWRINKQGKLLVEVYDQNTPRQPALLSPSCYSWQDKPHKLQSTPCR